MKKWLLILISIALVATAGIALVFATLPDGDATLQPPATSADDVRPGDPSLVHDVADQDSQPPVTSVDGIELDDPSLVHNVDSQSGQPPVTSIDNIDPNECSLVHNVDACETP